MPNSTTSWFNFTSVLIAILLLFAGGPAQAGDLRISHQGGEEVVTREQLARYTQVGFTTSTIWTDGQVAFQGVPLKALLEDLGLTRGRVVLSALNDYSVAMPLSDLDARAPIIASSMNGEAMSPRTWGPYWLVYPYDDDRAFRTETIYSRSIWQLVRITVMD